MYTSQKTRMEVLEQLVGSSTQLNAPLDSLKRALMPYAREGTDFEASHLTAH